MAYPTPTEESNPAARLSRLIAKAMRTNDSSKSALEAWGDALDILRLPLKSGVLDPC